MAAIERRYVRYLPLVVLLGLVTSGLEGIGIGLLVPLLTIMLSPGTVGAYPRVLATVVHIATGLVPNRPILALCALTLLLVLCKAAVQMLNAAVMAHVEGAAGRDIRDALARKMLHLDFGFFLQHDTARLITVIDTDSWKVTEAIRVIFNIAVGIAAVAMFTFLLFLARWRLALLVLTGVALGRLVHWSLSRRLKRLGRAVVATNRELGEQMMQIVRAIRVIRLFGQEDREEARFVRQSAAVHGSMLASDRWSALSMPLIEIILSALILLVLTVAYGLGIGLPATAAFLVLLYRMQGPLMATSHAVLHLATLRGSVEEVERMFALPDAVRPDRLARAPEPTGHELTGPEPTTPELTGPDRAIRFEGVGFRYPTSDVRGQAVRDLSFSLAPGSVTALVGRSGAGKSTVVNLLCRLVEPTEGRILLGDDDLALFDPLAWRRRIAVAGQDVDLTSGTVAENIGYGVPEATMAEVEEAAHLADAHGFIQGLPQGFHTHLGALGFGLSGGQRQRIGLARALLRRPEILILDEATSAVDGVSERTITALLHQHRGFGRAVVISHRPATLSLCDQAIVIENGQVAEYGRLSELAWFAAATVPEERGERHWA